MSKNKRIEKNSKKYKSQVKKDIQKKSAEKANKDKRVYNSGAGGTKVVKRVRSDVYTAPAIYGGRMKYSGKARSYNQYYPYQEGVIDKQMALTNYYNTALKQHSSRNQWQNLISGLSAGQFEDLDKNRREILAKQAIEEEKRIRLEELANIKQETINKENENEVRLKNLKIETGATDAVIAKHLYNARNALEEANEKEHTLRNISEHVDKTEKSKSRIKREIDFLKEHFPKDGRIQALTDNTDELSLDTLKDLNADLKALYEKSIPITKAFMELRTIARENIENDKIMNNMEEEMAAWGKEDPELAGLLAKKRMKYGSREDRMAEIQDSIEKKQQFFKNYFESFLPEVNKKLDECKRTSELYRDTRKKYRSKATDILLETDLISPEDREKVKYGKFTDVELAQRMEAISPMFASDDEVKRRMDFYSDKLKRYSNPLLMNQYKLHDRYLKPMELMSDFFDRTTAKMDRGETINYDDLENEMVDIAKVLLRNPRLSENVSYGPMLKHDFMLVADIPEMEQEPIVLKVSDRAEFEEPMGPGTLEMSNSRGVSTNPTDLEVSPRSSYEESDYGGWNVEKADPTGSQLEYYRPKMTEEEERKHLEEINKYQGDRPFRSLSEFDAMVKRGNNQSILVDPEEPKKAKKRKIHDIF